MSSTPTTPAAKAMAAHLRAGTTAQLAASLLALDLVEPDQRRAAALVVDELANRHPEVKAAVEAWVDDLGTEVTLVEAAVAALPKGSL